MSMRIGAGVRGETSTSQASSIVPPWLRMKKIQQRHAPAGVAGRVVRALFILPSSLPAVRLDGRLIPAILGRNTLDGLSVSGKNFCLGEGKLENPRA